MIPNRFEQFIQDSERLVRLIDINDQVFSFYQGSHFKWTVENLKPHSSYHQETVTGRNGISDSASSLQISYWCQSQSSPGDNDCWRVVRVLNKLQEQLPAIISVI